MSSSLERLPARNTRGAFATPRNPVDLYSIVRDVALAAAAADPDPLKSPAEVSERAWDAARWSLVASWGKVAVARQVCMDLRDRDGRPYKWRELLADVFRDEIDYAQHHGQRVSARDRSLTDEHVFWALNHVAHFLAVRSLRPHEYETGRRQLLEQNTGSEMNRRQWECVLPTGNQLTTHAKTWDRALELAELDPREAVERREVPSPSELIARFFLRHGHLPLERRFKDFLNQEELACAAWQHRSWDSWCVEACDLLAAQGFPRPVPHPSKSGPDGWQAINADLSGLPKKGIAEYSRLQVLEAVCEFKFSLEPRATPTDKRYQAFSNRRNKVPGLRVVQSHGGLQQLLREIALPDWHERALAEQQALADQAAKEQTAAAERKLAERELAKLQPRRRDPETKMRLLRLLQEQGALPSRDIVDALKLSRMAVRENAAQLEALALVTGTEANLKSPNRRYVLTPAGVEALKDELALRELLATYRPPTDELS